MVWIDMGFLQCGQGAVDVNMVGAFSEWIHSRNIVMLPITPILPSSRASTTAVTLLLLLSVVV